MLIKENHQFDFSHMLGQYYMYERGTRDCIHDVGGEQAARPIHGDLQ